MFTGNVNNDDELQTMFDLPVKARYVRIVIETWHGGPALRAGALTCQEKCQAQHLDYKTNLGLTSSTGGPGLIEEWGHETTSVSSGYRASAGKGLFLDARSCLSDPDSWTVIVQASLDTMRPKAGLMSAESWGDAGMYVVDEHYSMFPSEKLKCQELIRVGRNYWFAAVRDGKTNNVTVFLNGCAHPKP
ncbi:hypothetical protein T484DRAFT_3585977 [Baffinella frigidus]|nr:hypothetical protein T484DRAFT_3585977 [Cryptophyta sp. CCMP2293]